MDFWHCRYNEPITNSDPQNSGRFCKDYGASDEQYCKYINRGMYKKAREREGRQSTNYKSSRPREKKYKENFSEKPYVRQVRPEKRQSGETISKEHRLKAERQLKEYHQRWDSLMNATRNHPSFFDITSIPWPFPVKQLRAAIPMIEDPTQGFLPEDMVSKDTLLQFLGLDFNGPFTQSQISERKKNLKLELLKWHPDRFHQYHLLPVQEAGSASHTDRKVDATLSLVNHISQLLQECWSHL
ncbi:hypothetical protein DSO57_1029757 [Entomophthora muscae]|uniref:Uncharacterized protein n=1 Tax=Entomophthora muscae TaxID=34485 RepID=A0ACC2UMD0_9FUNG|nr:hypothetical protein DSO57_1029757 [Entomophthora muscae]